VILGLNHEQQHQELIATDLKHMLSHNPLHPVYVERLPNPAVDATPMGWSQFPERVYWIAHEGTDFTFDNEEKRHREFTQSFRLASRLVTNAEYLRFVPDGGYEHPEFWLSMGWATEQQERCGGGPHCTGRATTEIGIHGRPTDRSRCARRSSPPGTGARRT
jgi:formylglycine-generating enzyme required for sulfatase activity